LKIRPTTIIRQGEPNPPRLTGAESQYQPVREPSALYSAHVPTGWETPLPVAVGFRADAKDASGRPVAGHYHGHPAPPASPEYPPALIRAPGPRTPLPPQAHFQPAAQPPRPSRAASSFVAAATRLLAPRQQPSIRLITGPALAPTRRAKGAARISKKGCWLTINL
jgi:hypothetical protein